VEGKEPSMHSELDALLAATEESSAKYRGERARAIPLALCLSSFVFTFKEEAHRATSIARARARASLAKRAIETRAK